jgi:hypothetical protein
LREAKATFIEPMLWVPSADLPTGAEWLTELFLLMTPVLT